MWPRAATGPETGPGPRSSPMLMKINSRALRHMHVSLFFWSSHQTTCIFDKRLSPSDFINLLDNYEMSTGVSETVTSEELQENRLFIDSLMETDVMKVQ